MYAAQALPTIRFEDMGGRTHELPAQTDCWPAPADLRADAPAPVIVSADEGGVTLIYACSDGAYRPLAQRREWLAEQQRDALVLALLPASTTGAMVGYVRGVAGSERPLPLLPARSEQRTWHMTQLSGYGWFLRPLSEEARVLRRELVNCDNGGLELLVGRYGWGHADVPPTRQGTCIAEVGGASLVITPGPEMPSAPKGWQVQAHIPPRPRFELDTPTRDRGGAGGWAGAERGRAAPATVDLGHLQVVPRGRPPTIVATGRQEQREPYAKGRPMRKEGR